MLTFSAQHPDMNLLTSRKRDPGNLFSEVVEIELEFEEVEDEGGKVAGLFSRVLDLIGKSKDKEGKDAALFTELGQAVEAMAEHVAGQGEAFTAEKTPAKSCRPLTRICLPTSPRWFNSSKTPTITGQKPQYFRSPAGYGGDGALVTDC